MTNDALSSRAAASGGFSGKKLLLIMLAFLAVTVFSAVVVPTVLFPPEAPKLEYLWTVPPFSLVDEQGQAFTEDHLRGQPTIVSFLFTRCDSICPAIAGTIRSLQDRTSDAKGRAVRFVSITIDPEHDTPARLRQFAMTYGADPTRWKLLTGPSETIKKVVTEQFYMAMDGEGVTASGAPDIVHRGLFLLVDQNLSVRGIYEYNDPHALDDLIRHARFLLRTDARTYKFGGS